MNLGRLEPSICLTCGKGIRFVGGFPLHITPDPTHRPHPPTSDTIQKRQALTEKIKVLPEDMRARIEETCRNLRTAAGMEERLGRLEEVPESEFEG